MKVADGAQCRTALGTRWAIRCLQQDYPDVAVTLVATGQSFEAVAVERLHPVADQ